MLGHLLRFGEIGQARTFSPRLHTYTKKSKQYDNPKFIYRASFKKIPVTSITLNKQNYTCVRLVGKI